MTCLKFQSKNSIRKVPHFDYLGSTRNKSLLYVPKGMKYNTTFFAESGVPDLVEHVCQESRRKTFRSILVHLDNARPHDSGKSEAALIVTKARPISAPAYSPDSSPSDFFLSGMLKQRMWIPAYSSSDELISAISELIASLPKGQFVSVYKDWMGRLNWVIKCRREYYHKPVQVHLTNYYIDRNRTSLRTF
jgi:hypothetical protein